MQVGTTLNVSGNTYIVWNLGVGINPIYDLDVVGTWFFRNYLIAQGGATIWTKLTVDWDEYVGGNVGLWVAPSASIKFNVNGGIKVSQWNTTCTAANAGEIKYDGACFQWCTSNAWWQALHSCTAGSCGASHNVWFYTIPTTNFCLSWTASFVSTHIVSFWTQKWTRTCTAPWGTASCYAHEKINGVCGATPASCLAGNYSAPWGCGGNTCWTCYAYHEWIDASCVYTP
jgi:hypothetical protein